MKQTVILMSLMSTILLGAIIGTAGVLGICHFGTYLEYKGKLMHSDNDQQVVLMTEDGTRELSFRNDNESELIVDDFEAVTVSGYYLKFLNLLQVEEINGDSKPELL